jgi:hypothetical protein
VHGRSYEFIFNFVPAEQRGQRRRMILLDRFQRIAHRADYRPASAGHPADYQAGVDLAVANGWLWRPEFGTCVTFMPSGTELSGGDRFAFDLRRSTPVALRGRIAQRRRAWDAVERLILVPPDLCGISTAVLRFMAAILFRKRSPLRQHPFRF